MKTYTRTTQAAARSRGYTLIEVLIAAGLLMMAIGAASSLSLTMSTQEEINYSMSRALNLQENYVKVYHLGLSPAEIGVLMPPEPSLASINTATSTPTITGVGPMESVTWDFFVRTNASSGAWSEGTWTGGDQGAERTVNVRSFRSPTH
jgi:type II secretory pathway pseudopilin PulG